MLHEFARNPFVWKNLAAVVCYKLFKEKNLRAGNRGGGGYHKSILPLPVCGPCLRNRPSLLTYICPLGAAAALVAGCSPPMLVINLMSTRRFFARPAAVLSLATC